MEQSLKELIFRFFEIGVVKFGNFKLKSGVQSPVYFDLRLIISYPRLMDLLTTLLVDLIRERVNDEFQHVCGVPYTALPMATLISAKSNVPMLIRRRETKDHGTKKIIEGQFKEGDKCIIIEDVISSGTSIIETVADLEKEGLIVRDAVVVLDREQGGLKNLQNRGIRVHVLSSLHTLLKILSDEKKISIDMVNEVRDYISKVSLINHENQSGISNMRLKMSFSQRAELTKNAMAKNIFKLMEIKKSLLCLAADVTTSKELVNLATLLGPHICILKTHFDIIKDFTWNTYVELRNLAKKLNFLIMEDRKFSDIGNTVRLQFNKIKPWADLVTSHSIAGEAILNAMKADIGEDEEKGCFLVAELSCQGHLITEDYAKETARMAEKNSDFVVGLVCQSGDLVKVPYLIQMTPGVKIEECSDHLGQRYNDPECVVLERGADLAVVGRGITASKDPEKEAVIYKEKLWNAYQKRLMR